MVTSSTATASRSMEIKLTAFVVISTDWMEIHHTISTHLHWMGRCKYTTQSVLISTRIPFARNIFDKLYVGKFVNDLLNIAGFSGTVVPIHMTVTAEI